MPHISYAGVRLLMEDPGYEFQVWLERSLSLEDLLLFGIEPWDLANGRNRPRGPFVGGVFPVVSGEVTVPSKPFVGIPVPNYAARRPPRWKINTLWWPSGATRWAIGLFLCDAASLRRIVRRVSSTNGLGTLAVREYANGSPGVILSTQMYMLPPRELNNTNSGVNGYLLCLVDERFYWQFLDTDRMEIDGNTTWEQVYAHLGTHLGKSIVYDPIKAGYVSPNIIELTRRFENIALIMDGVAWSVGQRIVYDLNGVVRAQNADTARTQRRQNQQRLLARGFVAGGEHTQFRQTLYPQTVRTVFPIMDADTSEFIPGGEVYEVTVEKGDVSADTAGFIPGTEKVVHTTAPAIFAHADILSGAAQSGAATPINLSQVNALAVEIATAYYDWLSDQYDQTGVGLMPWTPNGFDDYIWWHFGFQNRLPYAAGLEYVEQARAGAM